MSKKQNSGVAILISGASSGIGMATALLFDSLGYKVYAGILSHEDGINLISKASKNLVPVILDVTNPDTINHLKSLIDNELQHITRFILFNNCGIAKASPLELQEMSEIRLHFEINYFGMVSMIKAFLPILRSKNGRIINTCSISGISSMPFTAAYCSSKFAVEGLADALRLELKPWNIHVSNILPGDIRTEIWQKAVDDIDSKTKKWTDSDKLLYGPIAEFMKDEIRKVRGSRAEVVAKEVLKLVNAKNPKARVFVGQKVIFYRILESLPTKLRDKLVGMMIPKYGYDT